MSFCCEFADLLEHYYRWGTFCVHSEYMLSKRMLFDVNSNTIQLKFNRYHIILLERSGNEFGNIGLAIPSSSVQLNRKIVLRELLAETRHIRRLGTMSARSDLDTFIRSINRVQNLI